MPLKNYINLKSMIEFIQQPWSWYFSGFMIFVIMLMLLYWGKSFGFSANLRTLCTLAGAGKKTKFFDFDWRTQRWNLLFLVGSVIGGFISSQFLKDPAALKISAETIADLKQNGFNFNGEMNPAELYSFSALANPKTILILIFGGLLIGFGTRYAGGCTSGHAISGLSDLQVPSMIAVTGFFIGGLAMTHLIIPFLF